MHTLLNRCDTEVVLKRADSLPGYCLSPNIHFLQRNLLEICQGSPLSQSNARRDNIYLCNESI
jgi:hypothetical protein